MTMLLCACGVDAVPPSPDLSVARAGTSPETCPPPEPPTCPDVHLSGPPTGSDLGPCAGSDDCELDAACLAGRCRLLDEVEVTLCVNRTVFIGPTCDGANLVHGVAMHSPAEGTVRFGEHAPWDFTGQLDAPAPTCAAEFPPVEACFVVPLDRLVEDGLVLDPIVASGTLGGTNGWTDAYLPGFVGTRAMVLGMLDQGCVDLPPNNTIGHRSTVSLWGP